MKRINDSGFFKAILLSLLIFGISGCGLLNDDSDISPKFQVTIGNNEVTPDEPVDINLSVRNPSARTMIIRTSCQEFANLFIYKNNDLVHFRGNNSGCSRVINTYELRPHSELNFDWNLKASLVSWNPGTMSADTTSAAQGEYMLQIRVHAFSLNGRDFQMDHIERPLNVR